jgi:hypothetical protein
MIYERVGDEDVIKTYDRLYRSLFSKNWDLAENISSIDEYDQMVT